MTDYTIASIVISGYIGGSIDLEKMSACLKGVEYEPEMMPFAIYRVKEPKQTIVIWPNRVRSMGQKTLVSAKESLGKLINLLDENSCIDGDSKINRYVIENIVATSSLEIVVNFDLLMQFLGNAIYEPEQFPGIIYKPEKKGLTFLIFASGKIVIVGGRSEEQIRKSLSDLRSKLEGLK
jgi:transcription initiation factor TFIID TATA-box-binding protein